MQSEEGQPYDAGLYSHLHAYLLTCVLLSESLPLLKLSILQKNTVFQNGSVSGKDCCHDCEIPFAEEGS